MAKVKRTYLPHDKTLGSNSKSARLSKERICRLAYDLECEGASPWWVREIVPEAWDTLEQDVDVPERKVQISLRLDESVAKFFRASGPGYQARINRVLALFAQMRIAQINQFELRLWAEREQREQDKWRET